VAARNARARSAAFRRLRVTQSTLDRRIPGKCSPPRATWGQAGANRCDAVLEILTNRETAAVPRTRWAS